MKWIKDCLFHSTEMLTISASERENLKAALQLHFRNLSLPGIRQVETQLSSRDTFADEKKREWVTRVDITLKCMSTNVLGQMPFDSYAVMGSSYNMPSRHREPKFVQDFSMVRSAIIGAIQDFCGTKMITLQGEPEIQYITQENKDEPHPETPAPFERDIIGFEVKVFGIVNKKNYD